MKQQGFAWCPCCQHHDFIIRGDIVAIRELIKRDIELLPDEALDDLRKYVLMQKFYFNIFDNDTDYLNSIPGMADKIISGMQEPLSESIPADMVEW